MEKAINFVVLSPRQSENFQKFVSALKAHGARVLGISTEHFDNFPELLREALTDYYQVDDMEEYSQLHQGVAYFEERYGTIDRLESNHEFWLETTAYLRTDFNIVGLKVADIERFNQKSKMKEIFRSIGVPVAKGRTFDEWDDAKLIVEEIGYPVVVKLNKATKASETWCIQSDEELATFFVERNTAESFMMEEFIEGDMVTFDGLVDHEGRVIFYQQMVYDKPTLEVVSGNIDCFIHYSSDITHDIAELGLKCVSAFGMKGQFFRFEFFRLKKDHSLVAFEVNGGIPPGPMLEMVNFSRGIDSYDYYAQVVLHQALTADLSQPKNCAYVSRKRHIQYLSSQDDIYAWYGEFIVSSVSTEGAFGDVGYFIVTDQLEDMMRVVRFIQERA